MNQSEIKFEIREVEILAEMTACVALQREVFALPDLEISPLRHLVVTKNAGGFILGAFADTKLVGFVLTVALFDEKNAPGFYSHMTAVKADFQNYGIGAKLKWAQREKALLKGKRFIKWTFHPLQARNAHFNLNRLGAVIKKYAVNFYGTDYAADHRQTSAGIDSDRLFAEWQLDAARVEALSRGETLPNSGEIGREIEIPAKWAELIKENPAKAKNELLRVRGEFQNAFAEKLVCAGFARDGEKPKYLFYKHL